MSKVWRAARSVILQRSGRGLKEKPPCQRSLSGERGQIVQKTIPSMTGRFASSSSIQSQHGHRLWVGEQTFIRFFSSQVVSHMGVNEAKAKETADVETEADPNSDALDIEKVVDSVLQDTALENKGWDDERDKSQQALWGKIERVNKGPQKSVVPLIKEWLAEGYTLDKRVLVTILIRLRRRARFKQAMEISDWMSEEKGINWELADQVVRIDLKAKNRQFSIAESLLENAPSEFKTELAYHTLLKNYADNQMSFKAEALMDKLKASGLLSLPFAFNQMLLLYKRKDMDDKLLEVLQDMKAAGVSKDVYTYNILMDVKARNGDIVGMQEVFEELKADESVEPDAATYGTLATAYVHAGLYEQAKIYLKEMEEGNVFRNRSTNDILISQYGAVGDVEGVERVWGKIRSAPNITNRSYITAIEAFGKLGLVERAEEIFNIMGEEKGLLLSRQFNALLSAYTRAGMGDKAEKLLEDMGRLGRRKNAITYHHLVTGYLNMDKFDKALSTLKEAQGDSHQGRIRPWRETITAILDACAEKGDVLGAEKHFQDLKKAYPRPSLQAYNILLKAYVNSGVPALGFLQRLMADKLSANDETLNLLRQQTGLREDSQPSLTHTETPAIEDSQMSDSHTQSPAIV